jgi:hypothetical protein
MSEKKGKERKVRKYETRKRDATKYMMNRLRASLLGWVEGVPDSWGGIAYIRTGSGQSVDG